MNSLTSNNIISNATAIATLIYNEFTLTLTIEQLRKILKSSHTSFNSLSFHRNVHTVKNERINIFSKISLLIQYTTETEHYWPDIFHAFLTAEYKLNYQKDVFFNITNIW